MAFSIVPDSIVVDEDVSGDSYSLCELFPRRCCFLLISVFCESRARGGDGERMSDFEDKKLSPWLQNND